MNELKEENKTIQEKRDSLLIIRKKLESNLEETIIKNKKLNILCDNLEKEVNNQKEIADKSKKELYKLRSEIEKTKKIIEDLKNHPPNRDGEYLLNSLRIKSKK